MAHQAQAQAQPKTYFLNRYDLQEKMGEGGFSSVYRAVEVRTQRPVALKMVSKRNISSTQRDNVLKETALLRRLDHPNIVKMYNFHDTPQHYTLVLELMSQGELFNKLVKDVYFSEPVARHVVIQIAIGIQYLHEVQGIVHRDIKLENLLYEAPSTKPGEQLDYSQVDAGVTYACGIGNIKIADFGLSKVIFDKSTRTPCGTVGYTAPEILNDERYDKGVDIWALGCVLYTVLCGFPPFYDEDQKALAEKVARGEFKFLSPWWDPISFEAKDLVTRCLEVDPAKRYSIDAFLNHPWC
ncbi:hypothetical protein CXG81DRAFT_10720, partial [Caulochytrium protostelioides]